MQCTTVSVNGSLTRYRFGSIIFHRGKCFVSLRTISECGGIHEPKRNTSQSQTQSTRGGSVDCLIGNDEVVDTSITEKEAAMISAMRQADERARQDAIALLELHTGNKKI